MLHRTMLTAPTTAADRQTTTATTTRSGERPTKGFKILEARKAAVANGDGTQKSQHAQWFR